MHDDIQSTFADSIMKHQRRPNQCYERFLLRFQVEDSHADDRLHLKCHKSHCFVGVAHIANNFLRRSPRPSLSKCSTSPIESRSSKSPSVHFHHWTRSHLIKSNAGHENWFWLNLFLTEYQAEIILSQMSNRKAFQVDSRCCRRFDCEQNKY